MKKGSFNARVAVWMTQHIGSMGFFWGSIAAFVAWMAWNVVAPRALRFDHPPWFPVLLFLLNVGQWLFIGVVAVGQNVLNAANEGRSQQQYEMVRRLDALETQQMQILDHSQAILEALANKEGLSGKDDTDPEVRL